MLQSAVKEHRATQATSAQNATWAPEVLQAETADSSSAITVILEQTSDKVSYAETVRDDAGSLGNRSSIFVTVATLLRHFPAFDVTVLTTLALLDINFCFSAPLTSEPGGSAGNGMCVCSLLKRPNL
jgi:hypothetical protein